MRCCAADVFFQSSHSACMSSSTTTLTLSSHSQLRGLLISRVQKVRASYRCLQWLAPRITLLHENLCCLASKFFAFAMNCEHYRQKWESATRKMAGHKSKLLPRTQMDECSWSTVTSTTYFAARQMTC